MKTKILAFGIVFMVLLLVPNAYSKGAGQNPDPLTKFEKELDRDGFIVTTGMTDSVDWAQEYCDGIIANAGYVNKAPYLRLLVPVMPKDPQTAQDPALVDSFQLRPDEAIVMIGVTPPPIPYFGYYPFLWKKAHPDDPDNQKLPLQAAVADAVNNATINHIGPAPYNSPVVLIFTPDQGTDARVRAALQRAGYPPAIMNTVVFPASMLNLGYGNAGDEFRIVMRLGGEWKDPVAGKSFIDHVSETLKVFRVTPQTPAIANPFPVPRLRVRGTGQTEMDLMNEQGLLRKGIIDANAGLNYVDILSKPNWYEAYDYIQRLVNPGADVRDALLLSAGFLPEYDAFEKFKLADGEFLMVYGADHEATGKATYMSINVYASEKAKLSIGQVFHKDLMGTAAPYLPAGDPAAKVMYAYKVSRNCGGEPNCLQLGIDYDCPPLIIDADTILALIFRSYLEPSTKVGPAMPEILYDRIIKFSPRP